MLTPITDSEFRQIQSWLYGVAGISLSDQKKALVMGRLNARLKRHQLNSYGEYFNLLTSGIDLSESQLALDLLTTNETHFFRELKHFDFLREHILSRHPPRRTMRIWSAACSTSIDRGTDRGLCHRWKRTYEPPWVDLVEEFYGTIEKSPRFVSSAGNRRPRRVVGSGEKR